ncbi:MAG: hypothetical protein PF961_12965 [Planctomycetota bacterium]|jgi:enoyl reductase-like protein|nr:hypothetical protein [Planctomycetota bacterium]
MSAADSNIGELSRAMQDLGLAFQRSADQWRDATRDEFFAQYLEPIEQVLNESIKSLAITSAILEQVHGDCR